MAQIYIAFVDTPGFFAGIIRRVIEQKYIHVVLSMDPELEEAYSVGRRNPAVPLSLCGCRAAFYSVEQTVLSGKPLYLFFLCGKGVRGLRSLQVGETFFTGDTAGFHGKIRAGEDL